MKQRALRGRLEVRRSSLTAVCLLALVIVASAPSAARACAVCFGGEGTDWPAAFNLGVVLLLAMPAIIVSAAGFAIYRAIKQKEAQAAASERARS